MNESINQTIDLNSLVNSRYIKTLQITKYEPYNKALDTAHSGTSLPRLSQKTAFKRV